MLYAVVECARNTPPWANLPRQLRNAGQLCSEMYQPINRMVYEEGLQTPWKAVRFECVWSKMPAQLAQLQVAKPDQ